MPAARDTWLRFASTALLWVGLLGAPSVAWPCVGYTWFDEAVLRLTYPAWGEALPSDRQPILVYELDGGSFYARVMPQEVTLARIDDVGESVIPSHTDVRNDLEAYVDQKLSTGGLWFGKYRRWLRVLRVVPDQALVPGDTFEVRMHFSFSHCQREEEPCAEPPVDRTEAIPFTVVEPLGPVRWPEPTTTVSLLEEADTPIVAAGSGCFPGAGAGVASEA